ncbi:MAG: YqeG family HAD IIIA-type phosphatase [Vulcanimicrobiaceae bacterium]|jgi:HAD superfamily phosphatase (TIGR01668 family)
MLPDSYARGLAEISLESLAQMGVRGIIVDLDNTLVAYRAASVEPAVAGWVKSALARGFRVVLVSNNWGERVATFGAQIGVPSVPSAMKPLPLAFLRALRVLGTPRAATVVVGDQLFTDVLGAKLLGMRAILTEPISEHGFITTRAMRVVERALLRWARR